MDVHRHSPSSPMELEKFCIEKSFYYGVLLCIILRGKMNLPHFGVRLPLKKVKKCGDFLDAL